MDRWRNELDEKMSREYEESVSCLRKRKSDEQKKLDRLIKRAIRDRTPILGWRG